MNQKLLFPDFEVEKNPTNARSGTFLDNMKIPIHRWFRYSAGYSAEWVKDVIKNSHPDNNSLILDPFAGSGTTLLASNECGFKAIGFEQHYFIRRLTKVKLSWPKIDTNRYLEKIKTIIELSKKDLCEPLLLEIPLLKKCYSIESMQKLEALKKYYLQNCNDNELSIDELIWMTLTSILRKTSDAGTAQWQYILPNKRKKDVKEPFSAFYDKALLIISDIEFSRINYRCTDSELLDYDARNNYSNLYNTFDLLITSPPYPNNYDYADSTRLELLFWQEISGWRDLQTTIRSKLIRSCSQHTSAEKLVLEDLLSMIELQPIKKEISDVCYKLAEIRLTKGGRKTYHTMIAAYYLDIAKTFISLRKLMKNNSCMCWVIGDSAPYGIYAPADRWMIKLAIAAGFKDAYFEKIRDRNIKWKNRKHDVLLKEGRLWIKG